MRKLRAGVKIYAFLRQSFEKMTLYISAKKKQKNVYHCRCHKRYIFELKGRSEHFIEFLSPYLEKKIKYLSEIKLYLILKLFPYKIIFYGIIRK